MNNDELLLRQQGLVAHSTQLRDSLANQAQVFRKPLAMVDQARHSLQWLYRNPQWPLGVLLVVFLLRPRRTVVWGGRVWWAWTSFNRAKTWLKALPVQPRSF